MLKNLVMSISLILFCFPVAGQKAGDEALGTLPYEKFQEPDTCASCHLDIHRQHEQAMMSKSYIHHWDEIEYFDLADKLAVGRMTTMLKSIHLMLGYDVVGL